MDYSKTQIESLKDLYVGKPRRCAKLRIAQYLVARKNSGWRPVGRDDRPLFDYVIGERGRAWLSSYDGRSWGLDVSLGSGTIGNIRDGYREVVALQAQADHGALLAKACRLVGCDGHAVEGHISSLCKADTCACECAGCVVVGLGVCRKGRWDQDDLTVYSEGLRQEIAWCCGDAWVEGVLIPEPIISMHPQPIPLPPVSETLAENLIKVAQAGGGDPGFEQLHLRTPVMKSRLNGFERLLRYSEGENDRTPGSRPGCPGGRPARFCWLLERSRCCKVCRCLKGGCVMNRSLIWWHLVCNVCSYTTNVGKRGKTGELLLVTLPKDSLFCA